jgi:hypothetical protein
MRRYLSRLFLAAALLFCTVSGAQAKVLLIPSSLLMAFGQIPASSAAGQWATGPWPYDNALSNSDVYVSVGSLTDPDTASFFASLQAHAWEGNIALTYASEARFEADLAAGKIPSSVTAVMYDSEGWDKTPDAEQQDPVTYHKKFWTAAKSHGYKVIVAPSCHLLQVEGTVLPGGLDPNFTNCAANLLAKLAPYADILDFQFQSHEQSPSLYASVINGAAAVIKKVNPSVKFISELSTGDAALSNSGLDLANPSTLPTLIADAQGVLGRVDGLAVWNGKTPPAIDAAFQLLHVLPGWYDGDAFPRYMADVDGDGLDDYVGFAPNGVYVSRALSAGGFAPPVRWSTLFTPTNGGWSNNDRYPRMLADVNGDGKADIVAFGGSNVLVSLSTGSRFTGTATSIANFTVNSGGWSDNDKYPRMLADVNGDGKADIIGFGYSDIWVALANTTTKYFDDPVSWGTAFTADGTWTSNTVHPRMMADVSGDGKADIVAFGNDNVYVAFSNGRNGFNSMIPYMADNFTVHKGGWTDNNTYPRMLADVNGDGKADIVGFGGANVFVAINNGHGFNSPPAKWTTDFSYANGWTDNKLYPRFVANVTGTKINGRRVSAPVGFAVNTADIMKSTGTGFVAAVGH